MIPDLHIISKLTSNISRHMNHSAHIAGHRFYDFVLTLLIASISLEIFVGIIIIYIGNLHYYRSSTASLSNRRENESHWNRSIWKRYIVASILLTSGSQ